MTDDDLANELWLRIVRKARELAEARGDVKPTSEDYAEARRFIIERHRRHASG